MIVLSKDTINFIPKESGSSLPREFELLQGYNCPHCKLPVYGIFRTTERVRMTPYAMPTQQHISPVSYTSTLTALPANQGVQIFAESSHCKASILSKAKQEHIDLANSYLFCGVVKLIWEVNPLRALTRILRNLESISYLSVEPINEFLKKCVGDSKLVDTSLDLLVSEAKVYKAMDVTGSGIPLYLLHPGHLLSSAVYPILKG